MKFVARWFRGAKVPMLDCDAVMRQLWDYLDGELTPERTEAIREHIAMCSRCQPHTEFERTFLAAVSRAQREHSHLDLLRDQLLVALGENGFAPRGGT